MISRFFFPGVLWVGLLFAVAAEADFSEKWRRPYEGEDATGAHVLGYWTFDSAQDLVGKSSHRHAFSFAGARFNAEGQAGGGIESFPGYPVSSEKHAVVVKHHEALSPRGAFAAEMWIRPKEEFVPELRGYLLDKKYVSDRDYQWILGTGNSAGGRRLEVYLGFGDGTERFVSEAAVYGAERWHHVAFSYDGRGTVRFFKDGALLGEETKAGRGAVTAGNYDLSIGDRRGSNYGGFAGFLDEVRICEGAREFRPLAVEVLSGRRTFVRMEEGAKLSLRFRNLKGEKLEGVTAMVAVPGRALAKVDIGALEGGAEKEIVLPIDTKVRPGDYEMIVRMKDGEGDWAGEERAGFAIVPRELPHRMPVVMWGLNSNPGIMKELPRLKEIGFTHCFGARTNYGKIYQAGEVTLPDDDEDVEETRRMLDVALAEDLRIITNPSAGRWLRDLKEFQRVDREGKPYARHDVNGLYPEVQKFCENVGASLAKAYAEYPAYDGALINTEVRGHSQVSFGEVDRKAYREATGSEIPEEVRIKNGVEWGKMKNFPADRVIADDDPIYRYYQWFWKNGDGWNGLHSAVHRGLKSTGREDFWTFHDPAVRTTSVYGSGGEVDFISQWTYSYPDPIRIGVATDELFAMAKGAKHDQGVMKMTQVIWYRSQTAPVRKKESAEAAKILASPWEDRDPGADYITIAPTHLREAFWVKMSRPIQGIMYHGWQSLVETHPPGAYRYTHPETQHELKRLVEEVVEPLGPMLLQVPDRKSDVAFLESFASQMYARRGTYGWNHSWAGDAYHILQYAHVQPEIVFDETVMEKGLDGFKVLAMFDCDVLTAGVVERVLAFQKLGGIVIGDERIAPALKADIVVESAKRTKKAEADRAVLVEKAGKLSAALEGRYQSYATATTADVVTRSRRYGSTDYIFAVNDRREFGTYVGQHGMVMENGLPVSGEVIVRRAGGVVYELPAGRRVEVRVEKGELRIPVDLGPAEGRVYVILDKAMEKLAVEMPEEAKRGGRVACTIRSAAGAKAVLPLAVEIRDPDGRVAEFSGAYGMVGGELKIGLDFAANDTPGLWEIRVEELLSHASSRAYVRLR